MRTLLHTFRSIPVDMQVPVSFPCVQDTDGQTLQNRLTPMTAGHQSFAGGQHDEVYERQAEEGFDRDRALQRLWWQTMVAYADGHKMGRSLAWPELV